MLRRFESGALSTGVLALVFRVLLTIHKESSIPCSPGLPSSGTRLARALGPLSRAIVMADCFERV